MKSTVLLVCCFCFVAITNPASAQFPRTFDAEVISVTDGDTVRVREADGTVHRLRFNQVDAPESDQPFGDESTQFVENKVMGETVTVTAEGEDQYGRLIADIEIGGENLNEELVKAGLAWWFYHFSDDLDLAALEAEAKALRRGLFASDTPMYPRIWRRGARLGGSGDDHTLDVDSPIVILAILPNPSGSDTDNEKVILGNQSTAPRTLDGWWLADDDGGSFSLDGVTVPAGGSTTVTLNSDLLLGNGGDEITLHSVGGDEVQVLSYGSAQNGRFIVP